MVCGAEWDAHQRRLSRLGLKVCARRNTGTQSKSIPGRSSRLRPEEDFVSPVAEYSLRVTGGSGRGWYVADDLRRVLPFFSLAFGLVAVITQPSSAADTALTLVPVGAWCLWAFTRNVPLATVSVAIVVPVVVAQRSGELEPVMFNASLLAFAAARWSRSLAAAASLGLLAAATPVLVALIQDPMEVATGIWVVAIVFVWVVGRAVARQERLVVELEGTRRQLARQALLAERRRIARDVHDVVGHGLAAVMLQVTSARHVLRRDLDAAEEALRSAEEVGRDSMQELRRTVTLLRSHDEAGMAAPVPSASEIPRARRPGTDGRSRRRAAHARRLRSDPAGCRCRRLQDRPGGTGERGSPRPARADDARARARKWTGRAPRGDEWTSRRTIRLRARTTPLRADRDAGAGDGARRGVCRRADTRRLAGAVPASAGRRGSR